MRMPTDKELHQQFERLDDSKSIDCRSFVMDSIERGRVRMRSRWIVLTEYLGLRTTWIVLVLTLVAILNLTLFMISRSPSLQFFEFGRSGWKIILANLPYGWWAIAFALAVAAIVAARRFSFSYAWRFQLVSAAVLMSIFFVSGVAFATGINDYLYTKLVEEPGAGNSLLAKIYCLGANRGINNPDAVLGEVLDVPTPSSLIVQTPTLEVLTVVTQAGTQWPGRENIERFQVLKMLGHRDQDVFWATHIKTAPDVHRFVLTRDEEDCINKQEWMRKQQVAQNRRQLVQTPFSPMNGMAQLIKSVR